jgi:hypothetical protein
MLITKFDIIWPSGFRGKAVLEIMLTWFYSQFSILLTCTMLIKLKRHNHF